MKKKVKIKPSVLKVEKAPRSAQAELLYRVLLRVAIALVAIGLLLGGFLIYRANAGYNYMEADLSRIVKLDADAIRDLKMTVRVDKPTDEDAEREIRALLVEFATPKAGAPDADAPVAFGSKIEFYYVGYYLEKDGQRTYFSGGSNLSDVSASKPAELTVGSALFFPGFEEGMIGVRPSDTELPSLITKGELSEGDIVHLNVTGFHPNGSTIAQYAVPVSLTPALDEEYGEGFYEMLARGELGRDLCSGIKILPSTTAGEGDFVYMSVTPQFKTEGGTAHTVEAYVPWNYDKSDLLKGKTVYFEVYLQSTTSYDLPELTDSFLTEVAGVPKAKLEGYEGETLVDKYKDYVYKTLKEDYEARLFEAAETNFWEKIISVAEVKRVPAAAKNEAYKEYMNSLEINYEEALETLGKTELNYPLKEFAIEFLQLNEGDNYRKYLRNLAEQTAREKIIFFYAIDLMDVKPSEAELKEAYEESILSLAKENNPLLSDPIYEDETDPVKKAELYAAYEKELSETRAFLLASYGEEYFLESAYYNYAFPKLLTKANVTYIGKGH